MEMELNSLLDEQQEEEIKLEKTSESRGRPIKCRYCNKEFKFYTQEEKLEWIDKEHPCPSCGELWCILPPTERELRGMQIQYFESRDSKILGKMYSILESYAQSLIKKQFSNRITPDNPVEYYSHMAATFFIEKYLMDVEFKIEISFGAYLRHMIRQALFGKQEHACAEESLDFEFEDGNTVLDSHQETRFNTLKDIEIGADKKNLKRKIMYIITAIEKYCETKEDNFMRLMSIYAYLKGGEIAFDRLFNSFDKRGKWMSIQTLDIMKKELMKEVSERELSEIGEHFQN
ncbi:MAG: hypothetical protein BWY64_02840 [bacterium ADurb.Bin363]|nr:MAG: hypothetical protein BWY64_02840 [bacterium ADurb.Bin363]